MSLPCDCQPIGVPEGFCTPYAVGERHDPSNDAALAALDKVDTEKTNPEVDADVTALQGLYENGPASLDQAARDRLVKRHGDVGKIALAYGVDPTMEPRKSLQADSLILMLRLIVLAIGFCAVALASFVLHRLVLGNHPLRGLDFGLLWRPGFAGVVGDAFRETFVRLVVPAWPALAAIALLIVLARGGSAFGLLLALAGVSLAAYLLLPAFCTLGPAWLVRFTVRSLVQVTPLVTVIALALVFGLGSPWPLAIACGALG